MEWRKLTENDRIDPRQMVSPPVQRIYAKYLKLASPPGWYCEVFDDAAFAERRGYTHVADIQAPDDKGGK